MVMCTYKRKEKITRTDKETAIRCWTLSQKMECTLKKIILPGPVKKIIVPCFKFKFFYQKERAEVLDFCLTPSGFNVKLGKKRETGGLDSPLQCKPGLLASLVRVC